MKKLLIIFILSILVLSPMVLATRSDNRQFMDIFSIVGTFSSFGDQNCCFNCQPTSSGTVSEALFYELIDCRSESQYNRALINWYDNFEGKWKEDYSPQYLGGGTYWECYACNIDTTIIGEPGVDECSTDADCTIDGHFCDMSPASTSGFGTCHFPSCTDQCSLNEKENVDSDTYKLCISSEGCTEWQTINCPYDVDSTGIRCASAPPEEPPVVVTEWKLQEYKSTTITVSGSKVIGTFYFKNIGSKPTPNLILEMQVLSSDATGIMSAYPIMSLVEPIESNCDSNYPNNVHKTFQIDVGESLTITLESDVGGGRYSVWGVVVDKCFMEIPKGNIKYDPYGESGKKIGTANVGGVCTNICNTEEQGLGCYESTTQGITGYDICKKSSDSCLRPQRVTCEPGTICENNECVSSLEPGKQTPLTSSEWKKSTKKQVLMAMCDTIDDCADRLDYDIECISSPAIEERNEEAWEELDPAGTTWDFFCEEAWIFIPFTWGLGLCQGEKDVPDGTCRATSGIDFNQEICFTENICIALWQLLIAIGVLLLIFVIPRGRR